MNLCYQRLDRRFICCFDLCIHRGNTLWENSTRDETIHSLNAPQNPERRNSNQTFILLSKLFLSRWHSSEKPKSSAVTLLALSFVSENGGRIGTPHNFKAFLHAALFFTLCSTQPLISARMGHGGTLCTHLPLSPRETVIRGLAEKRFTRRCD